MAEREVPKEFPDVRQKLAAPSKLSQFEKEKQAAEAKRLRAEAENAAALREFEESFADEDEEQHHVSGYGGGGGPPMGPRGGGGFGGSGSGMRGGGDFGGRGGFGGGMRGRGNFGDRGGFGDRGRYEQAMGSRGGPGNFGPPQGMPPPPSLKRKRALEEMREMEEARREAAAFGYEGEGSGSIERVGGEEREDVTPKPTVQLSSIAPGTTVEELKALLSGHLKVHSVRFTPPAAPGVVGRKSLTAIATLDSTTSAAQIDTAVSSLRERYIGCGFYLSISRHLSSAAQYPGVSGIVGPKSSEPFGAQSNRERNPKYSMRNAPPPGDQRGFAPPEYYARQGAAPKAANAQVEVHPPLDIATVRAIHTISDRILTEKDPNRAIALEALLMSLPDVQKDERFAFLYDSKTPAGLYYRFCLWGPASVDEQKRKAKGAERIFSDMDIDWLPPYKEVPFPDLHSLAQVTEHLDYDSSDEESDDDGDERKAINGQDGAGAPQSDKTRLSPLQRARFTRLLSRLPTTNARLRQGDISRITNYVINHAGGGAEDFVDLLLLNIEKPFSSTLAAKFSSDDSSAAEQEEGEEEDDYEPDDALPTLAKSAPPPPPPPPPSSTKDDPSNAKLIGLYIISDILSASSTAGAKNAWKYRQLFEAGFKAQKTFERLGRMDKQFGWGRMKAEQWKRKVGAVFGIWEAWSAFPAEALEFFKKSFLEPPLTEEERKEFERVERGKREAERFEEGGKGEVGQGWMSKFKRVERGGASPVVAPRVQAANIDGALMDDIDGAPVSGLDGTPMDDIDGTPIPGLDGTPVDDIDGRPIDDIDGKPMDDIDGTPMDDIDGTPMDAAPPVLMEKPKTSLSLAAKPGLPKAVAPKRRMKAEDMFGDDSDEG